MCVGGGGGGVQKACKIAYVIKDRQQEARSVLVGSRYIGDYYMVLELQYMYYIPLTTLLSGLFIDIKYVKLTGPETERAWYETEN